MMKPVSEPVIQPQPAVEAYGLQDLALFKTYTRDIFRAEFGREAPAYDPSRLTKTWFDSTADTGQPENVSVYKTAALGVNGSWGVRQLVIPASEAAALNLPGAVKYPPYIVAPTNALRTGPGGLAPQPMNADYLSTNAQALAMMREVGGTAVVEEPAWGGGFGIYYPPEEERRMWKVTFRGFDTNVGFLLKNRNAEGVGSPGHWDFSRTEPLWISDPAATGLGDSRPLRETPVRDLLPNERLQATLMGVSVVRTDLRQESAKLAGQFTPDDRAILLAIYRRG